MQALALEIFQVPAMQAAALDMQTVSGAECERGIHVRDCSTVELLVDDFLNDSAVYNLQEHPESTGFHLRLA